MNAWAEAARHYEACRSLVEGSEEELGIDLAELLTALGVALHSAAEQRSAWRALMRAIDLYRGRGDGATLAEAVLAASRIIAPPHRIAALLEEARTAVEGAHPLLEALLIARIGDNAAYVPRADLDLLLERGTMLADEHDFADAQGLLTYARGRVDQSAGRLPDAVTRYEEAFVQLDRLGRTSDAIAAKFSEATALLYLLGDADRGQVACEALVEYAQMKRLPEWRDSALSVLAGIHVARASFDEIDAAAADLMENGSYWARCCLATRYEIGGDLERAVASLPPVEMAAGVWNGTATVLAVRARVLKSAGRIEEASAELRAWAQTVSGAGVLEPDSQLAWISFLAGAGLSGGIVQLADESLCAAVYRVLTTGATGRSESVFGYPVAAQRGELALRLNLLSKAEQHFQFGVSQAEAQRLPIQHGVCLQGLAEVAERRGEREQAMEYFDRAG